MSPYLSLPLAFNDFALCDGFYFRPSCGRAAAGAFAFRGGPRFLLRGQPWPQIKASHQKTNASTQMGRNAVGLALQERNKRGKI